RRVVLARQVTHEEEVLAWPALGIVHELADQAGVDRLVGAEERVAGGDQQCRVVDAGQLLAQEGAVVRRAEVSPAAGAAGEAGRATGDVVPGGSGRDG